MSIFLFEDDRVRRLYPVTLGRPAFAISCASYRLIDLVSELNGASGAGVRPHLRALTELDFGLTTQVPGGGLYWWLNARLPPTLSCIREVQRIVATGEPVAVLTGDAVALACLPADVSTRLQFPVDTKQLLALVHRQGLRVVAGDLPLFDYPHDIIRYHKPSLGESLEHRLAKGRFREVADGLFIGEHVRLSEYVSADTRKGPVVIDQAADIGPFSMFRGPVYVGAGSVINEHSALKDGVALGHTTKVGGEVVASILEPYSNKQHFGFLGHSHIGSWVNLGAGTTNSDLKNTYGPITMNYAGLRVPAHMLFVGCFIGDYAKTAINTGIHTGKSLGVCSMSYGTITNSVPSFVNYAKSLGGLTELAADVAITSQQRMYARRNVRQRPEDIQLIRDMYELTRDERRPFEPLSCTPLNW